MKSGVIAALLFLTGAPAAALSPLDRMQLERLRATHAAVENFARQRRPVKAPAGFRDIRAVMHVHSSLSHDSRAPLNEILRAAKAIGIDAILFSEHPGPQFDYFRDGHTGLHDGVLLIPGAETEGLLVYPTRSTADLQPAGDQPARAQSIVDRVTHDGGLAFLSHLEARLNWKLAHLTGSEIYNTHADLKQDGQLTDLFAAPLGVALLLAGLERYPQETFAAIQDYPADYLRRYDQLCQSERLTGIAACDAHHNQIYSTVINAAGGFDLVDFQNKRLLTLPAAAAAMLRLVTEKRAAGSVVWQVDLDPYERTLRHVNTHLLVGQLDRAGVWQALREGRAYVSFDWMADPTGFLCQAEAAQKHWPLGSEVPLTEGLTVRVAAPLPCRLKLLRNGQEIGRQDAADSITWPIRETGVYRVEAWLEMAGEPRPWILANPLYVRSAPASPTAKPDR
jgi:hypothetical protein